MIWLTSGSDTPELIQTSCPYVQASLFARPLQMSGSMTYLLERSVRGLITIHPDTGGQIISENSIPKMLREEYEEDLHFTITRDIYLLYRLRTKSLHRENRCREELLQKHDMAFASFTFCVS